MARPQLNRAPSDSGTSTRALERLTVEQCLALLARTGTGRVAFASGPTPVILPMNYALDGRSVVLRTAENTLLGGLPDGTGVALEIDHVDLDYHTGWSVLLRGRIDRIVDADEIARCQAEVLLGVWAPGERYLWCRITPATVTGRRIA